MTTINGKEYRLPHLDVFDQFALASKISPILTMMSLNDDKSRLEKKFPQAFAALSQNMSREDKDEILQCGLRGARRQEPGSLTWSPVMVNGRLMYDDIDMSVVLRILWEVIEAHKLLDFFGEGPSTSTDQLEDQRASSGSSTRTAG